jgi:hypothetical protein
VQVLEIGKLNINVSEEDQRRLDEKQDVIAQAKVEAMAAQRGVAKAQAEAQARQFQLDQEFQNRARYVNQLDMQRYGQFAAAEATMGLGQGLAQGGDGASAAAMAQGMALGAGLGYGQRAAMPPGYPPPGYPPPGYRRPATRRLAIRRKRLPRLRSAAWLRRAAAGYGPPPAPGGYAPPPAPSSAAQAAAPAAGTRCLAAPQNQPGALRNEWIKM